MKDLEFHNENYFSDFDDRLESDTTDFNHETEEAEGFWEEENFYRHLEEY